MIEILYRDNDIIVCIKPAGLLSEGEGEDSLLSVLASQCGGQVFPVHRLERGAAGLLVFAVPGIGFGHDDAQRRLRRTPDFRHAVLLLFFLLRLFPETGHFN